MTIVLIISILLLIISFYISFFKGNSRLSLSYDLKFNKTGVVDIHENDIKNEAEIYNEADFIEYKCLFKDSCLNLINVGTIVKLVANNISDMITISGKDIPYPKNYLLPSGMTYSIPCFVEAATIRPFYNVYLLPMNDLSRIRMHISGKILATEYKSVYEVKYKLSTNNVSLAFNKEQKINLRYAIGADGSLTDADFTFKIDPKTNSFYIIVATKSWNPTKE